MPRHLLKTVYRKPVAYTTGWEALGRQPELAKLAMDAIAIWSIIEARMAELLVTLLGAQARPAIAMFSALTSSQAQMAALKAAASTVLPADDNRIFSAAMVVIRRVSKRRHFLAHWIWAYSDAIPDSLLLIDPAEFLKYKVTVQEQFHGSSNPLLELVETQTDGVWIYDRSEFENICVDFVETQLIVIRLSDLVRHSPGNYPPAERARRLLLSEPRIQKQLDRERPRSPTSPE
jgi:hypothetical protein